MTRCNCPQCQPVSGTCPAADELAAVTAERDALRDAAKAGRLVVDIKDLPRWRMSMAHLDDAPHETSEAHAITEKHDMLHTAAAEMSDTINQLTADKDRLDWLEQKRLPLIPCFGVAPPMGSDLPFPFDGWVLRSDDDAPKPLRTAIDDARKAQP